MTSAELLCEKITDCVSRLKASAFPHEAVYFSYPGYPDSDPVMFSAIAPLTEFTVLMIGVSLDKKPVYLVTPSDQFHAKFYLSTLIDLDDHRPSIGFAPPSHAVP